MSRSLTLSVPVLSLVAAALVGFAARSGVSFAQGQASSFESAPFGGTAAVRSPAEGIAAAARTQHTFDLSARSPAASRIEQALENPQGVDIEFVDQPLKEAMDYLSEAHGITIILDEKALQDEGIQTDEPLNQVLSGIALRSALNIMLEPLGLTYVVDNDVLKITTRVAADEQLATRVYDVRPLAQAGIDSDDLAQTIARTIRPGTWAGAMFPAATIDRPDQQTALAIEGIPLGSSTGVSADRTGSPSLKANPAAACFVCSLQGWVRADGAPVPPETGLVALDGALVVTHSQDVHRRIMALLEQLDRLAERQSGEGR